MKFQALIGIGVIWKGNNFTKSSESKEKEKK